MIETSLAPGLLLAMPHLLDPNFTRAVILMVEHNDEGSFGLVINQPSAMSARELLQSLDIEWRGDGDALVWRGGPVMPGFGWVLHDPIERLMQMEAPPGGDESSAEDDIETAGTFPIGPDLALSSGSLERLRIIAAEPPPHVRLLLGYAGWGPGQLAQEMARGSWLHADVSLDILFHTPPEDMWDRALRSLGIGPENLVQSMGIH